MSQHTTATTFNHTDQLGSYVAQTNSSQAVTATQQFDAFGMLVSSTGTLAGPFGFVGDEGYQTDASGLQLLGHRYYDPSTGRFLTSDPAQDGRNWYAYVANRPTIAIDRDGRFIIFVVAVLFLAAVLVDNGLLHGGGGLGSGGVKSPNQFNRDPEKPPGLRWDVPPNPPEGVNPNHIQYGPKGSPSLNGDGTWGHGGKPAKWPNQVWKFLKKYNWSQKGYNPPGGNEGGEDINEGLGGDIDL